MSDSNNDLKYFCLPQQRRDSVYLELQPGDYCGTSWVDGSICISDDECKRLRLYRVFTTALPGFDKFGLNRVSPVDWEIILFVADELGGESKKAIDEADAWAEKVFEEQGFFTICGI